MTRQSKTTLVIPWGPSSETMFAALTVALGKRCGRIVVGITLEGVARSAEYAAIIVDLPDILPAIALDLMRTIQVDFADVPTVVHTTSQSVKLSILGLRRAASPPSPWDVMYRPKKLTLSPAYLGALYTDALCRIARRRRKRKRAEG